MQVKPATPESLHTFALATVGPYPLRYDKILNEAFSQYGLMLTGNTLRQIAGGGSNSTAQEAVERFRAKLHKTLSTRIEFGADIPQEVSAQMSSVMSNLWTACIKTATQEFTEERDRIALEIKEAHGHEQDAKVRLDQCQQRLAALEQELLTAGDLNTSLQANIHQAHATQVETDSKNTQLQADLRARDLAADRLHTLLNDSKAQRKEDVAAFESTKEGLKQDFRAQISELKREQEAALGCSIKERDAARTAEARERSAHAETAIKLARTEQRLSQVQEQLSNSTTALEREQAATARERDLAAQLRQEVMHLGSRISELVRELASKHELASTSQEQLELLQGIRQSLDAQKR